MKAKVKATGKVVEVTINKCAVPVQGYGASSVYAGDDGKTYFDTELDFTHVYPDWQQVRIQAAIAAMSGLLHRLDEKSDAFMGKYRKEIVEESILQADLLIEELKKTI